MKPHELSTIPSAEKPALSDRERQARMESLAERLVRADGLDREALERVEQLSIDDKR
jgi:hypothetical protein